MFGSSVAQRASETGTPERTLYRRMDHFEAEGMEALFGWPLRSNGLRGGQAGPTVVIMRSHRQNAPPSPRRPKIPSASSTVLPQKPSESRSPYHASNNSHVRPNFGTSPRGAPLLSYHPSIVSSYRETKMFSQVKT